MEYCKDNECDGKMDHKEKDRHLHVAILVPITNTISTLLHYIQTATEKILVFFIPYGERMRDAPWPFYPEKSWNINHTLLGPHICRISFHGSISCARPTHLTTKLTRWVSSGISSLIIFLIKLRRGAGPLQSSRKLFQVCRTFCAASNVRQVFNALPDILIPCQTFFSVDDRQFFTLLLDIFPALNPAGQNVRQCWSPLPDISISRGLHCTILRLQ